jgi:peptidylprolyl isomerase
MDLLTKNAPVFITLILCGLLVVGVAIWVGGDTSDQAAAVPLTEIDTLPAPLAPEQLAAYTVDMTNETNPVAVMTTNRGVIEIELFADTMPITADNFISLANDGFYDGTKFHRVIEGFMIQGGDPISKTDEAMRYGTGGPGYAIPDEHIEGEFLTNVRGTIAMANSGPNSGGSQFFINLVDNVNLDFDKQPLSSKHPVFGRVLRGMDVVDEIGRTETNPVDQPTDPVVVESVIIRQS